MKRFILILFLLFANNAWATNYCANGNLGAGWQFDASSGTEPDCTSNGNTATGTGVTEGVTGWYNLAVSFPKSDSAYVSVPAASSINGLVNVSMGAWIKPNSSGISGNLCSGATIISKSDGSHGPELCVDSAGTIYFSAWWSGGAAKYSTTTSPVTFTGTWQHVAVTYSYSSSSNVPIFYYNGSALSTSTISSASGSQTSDSGNNLEIGLETGGGVGAFDGVIDEPFIANVTLSSTDISNIYNCGLDGTVCVTTPTVTTQAASSVTLTTATGNGNITALGSSTPTLEGVVWDSSSHSLPGNVAPGSSGYANNTSTSGSFSTGAFTNSITGLHACINYYYRAFAENSYGYAYGNEVNFITGSCMNSYNVNFYNINKY